MFLPHLAFWVVSKEPCSLEKHIILLETKGKKIKNCLCLLIFLVPSWKKCEMFKIILGFFLS